MVPQSVIHATASSLAELVSCLILTPAEVLKQNAQMITSNQQPTSSRQSPTLQALRHFQHPTQLWRGYTALAARNLPFTAIQFPLFEHLKTTIFSTPDDQSTNLTNTAMNTSLSAGLAGGVAAILTTPIDVIKTRIMLSATGSKDRKKRSGWIQVGKEIRRTEGVRALWRGGGLRTIWTALGSALYLGAYESSRVYLGDRRRRRREEEG